MQQSHKSNPSPKHKQVEKRIERKDLKRLCTNFQASSKPRDKQVRYQARKTIPQFQLLGRDKIQDRIQTNLFQPEQSKCIRTSSRLR